MFPVVDAAITNLSEPMLHGIMDTNMEVEETW